MHCAARLHKAPASPADPAFSRAVALDCLPWLESFVCILAVERAPINLSQVMCASSGSEEASAPMYLTNDRLWGSRGDNRTFSSAVCREVLCPWWLLGGSSRLLVLLAEPRRSVGRFALGFSPVTGAAYENTVNRILHFFLHSPFICVPINSTSSSLSELRQQSSRALKIREQRCLYESKILSHLTCCQLLDTDSLL